LPGPPDLEFDFYRGPALSGEPFLREVAVDYWLYKVTSDKVWTWSQPTLLVQNYRTHYYQRLVLSGWGHRKVVPAEYAVMALCGGFALFYQYASEEWRLVVLGTWGMVFLSLALAVKGVEQRIQPVAS